MSIHSFLCIKCKDVFPTAKEGAAHRCNEPLEWANRHQYDQSGPIEHPVDWSKITTEKVDEQSCLTKEYIDEQNKKEQQHDPVNFPKHYRSHPSGVECIQITEHMGFNLGSAMKYIWRCDLKNDAIEDLKKAVFYLQREISKREKL